MLLERLDPARTLMTVPIQEALQRAGTLLRRLAIPASQDIRRVSDEASTLKEQLPALCKSTGRPFPHGLLDLVLAVLEGLEHGSDCRFLALGAESGFHRGAWALTPTDSLASAANLPSNKRIPLTAHAPSALSSRFRVPARILAGSRETNPWIAGLTGSAEESMNKWLRKLKGVLGTGAVWGTAGLSVGAFLGAISSLAFSGAISTAWALTSGAFFGLFGLLSGVSFAGILSTLDGRKSFQELSAARSALWGMIAGAAFGFLFVLIRDGTLLPYFSQRMLPPMAALGALGACLGAGTILIARKTPEQLPPRTGEDLENPLRSSAHSQLPRSEEAQGSDPGS